MRYFRKRKLFGTDTNRSEGRDNWESHGENHETACGQRKDAAWF